MHVIKYRGLRIKQWFVEDGNGKEIGGPFKSYKEATAWIEWHARDRRKAKP